MRVIKLWKTRSWEPPHLHTSNTSYVIKDINGQMVRLKKPLEALTFS